MQSLGDCMDIVPAQGYMPSQQIPSEKLVRIPPAPPAATADKEKAPQNGSFPGGRSAGGIFESGR
jgi:hypothetical protein